MFSELCRETLRKAAVCYSSGRSDSPSPSPPNSPPSSPAKEAKSSANLQLANATTSADLKDTAAPSRRTVVTPPTSTFKERRSATPTDFSGRRSPGIEYRDTRRSVYASSLDRRLNEIVRGTTPSPGTSPEPIDEASTSEDEAGAAPEEASHRSSSAHNRHSIPKDVKRRSLYDEDSLDGDNSYDVQGRESVGSAKDTDRVKLVRDRQNEERQRKLEELRQQALAAQRFREQREEERRKRIDELRSRDNDRRNQVEERKRLIWEAERERREAILRKNQEREARIEAKKKNEKSQIVFAFGSSTPRMLEPADTGGSTFWGTRRATSTTNVMMFTAAQPLTRRSSERELDGSKKRATSAGGLDRKPGEDFIGDLKVTKDSKPPLPKVHSTPKKPSTPKTAGENVAKKPIDKLIKSTKASPRITPKATPLQSPGTEHPPIIQTHVAEFIKQEEQTEIKNGDQQIIEKHEEKLDHGTEKIDINQESATLKTNISTEVTTDVIPDAQPVKTEPTIVPELPKEEKEKDSNPSKDLSAPQTLPEPVAPVVQVAVKPEKKEEKKEEKKLDKKSPEPELKPDAEGDEPADMSASMIAKTRITTEEEAKAALAERRRLAREQAEREAELERQRIEEEARLEMERQRAEEEEQRRLEEESLRLASEARQAEEQRLRLAIEEAQRREEEDRKRREEEARQKLEKEEAEKKAREEAEKQRIEMAERLKKEEEERIARRKRVEAIMLRTRGKNQPNTPTKGEGGDGDKLKEDSPGDDNKGMSGEKGGDVMTASLISEATQQFIAGEQQALHIEHNSLSTAATTTTTTSSTTIQAPNPDTILRNGTHSNGVNGGSNNLLLIDNAQGNGEGEINGHNHTNHGNHGNHGNGVNSLMNEPIPLDNAASVKQNNATNNLLDLSEFDTMSNTSSGAILDLTPKLANEDSINSNLNPTATAFNPLANPFVPATTGMNANDNTNPFLQDTFGNNKTQDNNQVPDLLS
ncbi:ensconsin isoform X18 [Neodiprion lecontei]|uniref:Ensconsin isoform X18 n=1 Tax=Neodiprion lecontei TaxID=441921 RepID=A0ABM3G718_NEOLC|nr:ensconsin isoform X18 [Neodiprion lecontei]